MSTNTSSDFSSLTMVFFCGVNIVLHLMQTDPNWSNFLYDEATKVINLIDFGAARDYPKSFVDDYLRMVNSLLLYAWLTL